MLKKELDFVPQSPHKPPSRHGPSKSLSHIQHKPTPTPTPTRLASAAFTLDAPKSKPLGTRSTEEKKEILGTMLGNVDALVEGVRKAGIWGLAN